MLLLGAIALFQFWTMPAFFYPGDNFAIRAEAAQWVNTGRPGIPYTQRPELAGFLSERGQYFFENDEKELFYSRYGLGTTLFYLPPYAVYKALHGPAPLVAAGPDLLWILNLYSVFFATGCGLVLYAMAGLFTNKTWVRIFFTLASLYAGFASHYLKHPVPEGFQIFIALGFFYFALRFFTHEGERQPWICIAAASLLAGLLVLMKSSFVLFYPALGIGLLVDQAKRNGATLHGVILIPLKNYVVWIGVPALLAIIVLLAGNAYRFGSPFESGYGQWTREGVNGFDLAILRKSLPAFLWRGGNANIFLHFPIFALAIPGLILSYKKQRCATLFLGSTFLIYFAMISIYASWRGEWCYGPRHLVFILMGGAVAAVPLLDRLADLKASVRWSVLALMGSILAFSAWGAFQVNALHPFAYYQISGVFSQLQHPPIDTYFREYLIRDSIYRDIRLHVAGKQPFPPLQEVRKFPGTRDLAQQLDVIIGAHGQPNFWWIQRPNLD